MAEMDTHGISPYPAFLVRWALPVVGVAAALRLTQLAWPVIAPSLAIFYATVIVCAWLGGLGPGLASSALGAFVSEFFLMEPRHVIEPQRGLLRLGTFLFAAGLISWLSARRQRLERELRRSHGDLEELVRDRTADLRDLAAQLTLTEERERRKLALALHDNVGQPLSMALLRLQEVSSVQPSPAAPAEVLSLLSQAVDATRNVTVELSPPVLHELGLLPALEWLADRMRQQCGLAISLQCPAQPMPELPEELRILLFQAVRELLVNLRKHSRAGSGTILVEQDGDHLHLSVADEGIGAQPSCFGSKRTSGRGYGLFSIDERIRQHGGRLEIDSVPGQGTRVTLVVPLAPASPATPRQATKVPAKAAGDLCGHT